MVLNLLIKHLNQIIGLLRRLRQFVESLKLAHVREVVEEFEFLIGILFDNIYVLLLLLVHKLFFNLPFEVLVYRREIDQVGLKLKHLIAAYLLHLVLSSL